jgi:glyoxylase-like metal-dependent hydrolase (beta-lactamase superfamily II)
LLERRELRGLRLEATTLDGNVVAIDTSSRLSRFLGMRVSCYLVGDMLVDTGFRHAADLTVPYLTEQKISVIACTHSHEDHVGNCAVLARRHGCRVFLAAPRRRWDEGVAEMPLYRRLWWGRPAPYEPDEMPEVIRSGERELRVLPTPGHSRTHVALFEEKTGSVFTGDLFITTTVAAVMRHENPYESIRSLRDVADLEPKRLLNGHGLVLENPAPALRRKADRLEKAAETVRQRRAAGVSERRILSELFPHGRGRATFMRWLTAGEFSRVNFVRACLTHGDGDPAARPGPSPGAASDQG